MPLRLFAATAIPSINWLQLFRDNTKLQAFQVVSDLAPMLTHRSCYIVELRVLLYRDLGRLGPNPRTTPLLIHEGPCIMACSEITKSDPILIHRLTWLLRFDSEITIHRFPHALEPQK